MALQSQELGRPKVWADVTVKRLDGGGIVGHDLHNAINARLTRFGSDRVFERYRCNTKDNIAF